MTATQTATPHVAPRRRRLSGPLLGAAAVAAVLLLVGGALAVRAATTGSEPGAFLDWAPRGSLAADDAAIGQVRRTWDDGVSFELGAFFTSTTAVAEDRFTHTWRAPAPDPAATRHVAFTVVFRTGQALLVVVGEPGTTAISRATVAAPGVLLPLPVTDGVAVVPVTDGDTARIVVSGPGGTAYDGPLTLATVFVPEPSAVL